MCQNGIFFERADGNALILLFLGWRTTGIIPVEQCSFSELLTNPYNPEIGFC